MVGKQWWNRCCLLIATYAVSCLPTLALAQQGNYEEEKPSERLRSNPNEESKWRLTVRKVLKGESSLTENRSAFENYFKFYRLPMMTLNEPTAITASPKDRAQFYKEFMETSSDPLAHEALAMMILEYMQKIADGNYHPAVRFNAMMMLVDLNVTEVVRSGLGTGRNIADPHPACMQPMLDRFEADNTLDLVRLAALLGIVRQLEGDNYRPAGNKMDPKQRKAALDALVKLVQQKDPPAYRNAEGHVWMRRKAVEGLGYSMVSQADANLLPVLDTVLRDSTDDLAVRTAAANALGRVQWSNGVKYDVAQGLDSLGRLIAQMLQQEADRLVAQREYEASRVGPVGPGSTTGGGGGSYAPRPMRGSGEDPYGINSLAGATTIDPLAYRVLASRRQLRAWLRTVEMAVNGLDDRVDPKSKSSPPEPRGLLGLATAPAAKTAAANLQAEIAKLAVFLEEETEGIDTETYEQKLKGAAQVAMATFMPEEPAAPAAIPPGGVPEDIPGAGIPLKKPGPAQAPGDVPGQVPAAAPGDVPAPAPGDVPGDVPAPAPKPAPAPAPAPGDLPGDLPAVPN